jgi:hypothetical protein
MPSEDSLTEKLAKLANLHAIGVLSDDEFKAAKARLISKAPKIPEAVTKVEAEISKTAQEAHNNDEDSQAAIKLNHENNSGADETGGKTSPISVDKPLKWQSRPSQATNDKDAEGWRSVIGGLLLIGALAGFIAWDHLVGRLLPDEMYCAVGAGRERSETRAGSWSANGGCRAYIPGCATSWVTNKYCLHGSLWDAVKAQLHYTTPNWRR